jgi:hypothetical protein
MSVFNHLSFLHLQSPPVRFSRKRAWESSLQALSNENIYQCLLLTVLCWRCTLHYWSDSASFKHEETKRISQSTPTRGSSNKKCLYCSQHSKHTLKKSD